MALAGAMKVSVDTNTSSSGCIPATSRAMWRADVPFTVATAYLEVTYSATTCSNLSTNGPTEETQLVSRHSLRYFHSLPRISGIQSGMIPSGIAAPASNRIVASPISVKIFPDPLDRLNKPFLEAILRFPTDNLTRPAAVRTQPPNLAGARP